MIAAVCLAAAGIFLALTPLSLAGTCALYDPPTPGIHCFHSDEVDRAVSSSRTIWLVEFYSSWCGHCQHFAPVMKEIGAEVEPWSSVFRLGVLECTGSKVNQKTCDKYKVGAYPTLRLFEAHSRDPMKNTREFVGSRSKKFVIKSILSQIAATTVALAPLRNASILEESREKWTPLVLVFEKPDSYVGQKLILDFYDSRQLLVRRVLSNNSALLKHYSILEFPSLVVEVTRGDYHVIAGHSFEDPRSEFKQAILKYVKSLLSVRPPRPTPTPHPHHISPAHSPFTPTKINRVHRSDLLSAISYTLRNEVPIHSIISGSAYSALMRFMTLIEWTLSHPYPVAAASLREVRRQVEAKSSGRFITRRDWNRVIESKLNEKLFPLTPHWINCVGSRSHFRGYPCGLWMLMHTLTILTLPLPQPAHALTQTPPTSKEAIKTLSSFVRNFFSCEHCREHFSKMAANMSSTLQYDGDAVLWLWEAHNKVNRRLSKALSSDPYYPKAMFPEAKTCPYCYQSVVGGARLDHTGPNFNNTGFRLGESLVGRGFGEGHEYVWNKTAILLYLWNFYHLNPHRGQGGFPSPSLHVSPADILQAAWPKTFANSAHLHKKYYGKSRQHPVEGHMITGMGFNGVDRGICLMSYGVSFVVLGMLAYWLYKKRKRYRKVFHFP